ncbi:MAG: hypothetical protein ACK47B_18885 [Armatimonadota bacterium]
MDEVQTDVDTIAEVIRLPVERWVGRCFAVARDIVDEALVQGIVHLGHWMGPVAPESECAKGTAEPPYQHSWIRLPDGRVYDPTRWTFEGREPYVYVGEDSEGYYWALQEWVNGGPRRLSDRNECSRNE